MNITKAIDLLSDYCDRGSVALGPDFKDAVRMGKVALIRLDTGPMLCLDDTTYKTLTGLERASQRKG